MKNMMMFNLKFKNFFIFLKDKISNLKFLLTIMFSSLIILELGRFFNINLGYFYYFSLTPAVWLIYIIYDKYIVPIIARIIMKFINENKNIINIFKNINNNIFETIYKINISININIFNSVFITNSPNLIIDKNTIINIINELFKNKLYLNGFDDYVYYNDLNIQIATYHSGTPEDVDTLESKRGNSSRGANVSSNQGSQSVADRISNNPRHSPSAPYNNEDLIKWGINDLNYAKFKFKDIIAPCIDPYTNILMEILHGDMYNITSRSVLVYLNRNYTMSRIEIDESKVFSLYIKEVENYYDPVHGIWWNGYTGRWIDSDLYYIRGDIRVDQSANYKIKNSSNKYTTLFISRAIKQLSFDESLKNLFNKIHQWNIVHLNAFEYITPTDRNSDNPLSIEVRKSHMLKLDETSLNNYSNKLWPNVSPVMYFDFIVSKLLWEKSKLGIGTPERENISILLEQILAHKCQILVLNKNLSSNFLLLEKDYRWVRSSKDYMLANEERLSSMLKKPSNEIKVLKYVKPSNRYIG
jgi:hypothetical protein